MPEEQPLPSSDAERIRQLESELAFAQEALRLLRLEHNISTRTRRPSNPSLSEVDGEWAQESVSNRLARQIEQMRRERGEMCHQVEAEEDYLVNTLQRQLDRVQREKVELENALEMEQELLINRMRSLASVEEVSPIASNTAKSRCGSASVSAAELTRESNLQATVSTLQAENLRLLGENLRLAQLLRRHGIPPSSNSPTSSTNASANPSTTTPTMCIPLRRCDSGLSEQSRSGSISELRNAFKSDAEGGDDDSELISNVSPFRPSRKLANKQ